MQHHVIGSSFIFQHDKHIANAVKEYVDRKHTVEHYGSQSSRLDNFIETMWDHLDRERNNRSSSREEL